MTTSPRPLSAEMITIPTGTGGWRACEIVLAVAERGVPEAAELAEAYRETCDEPGPSGPTLTFAQTDIHSRAGAYLLTARPSGPTAETALSGIRVARRLGR